VNIGFDISQTGAGKAGCGYFADAMARGLVREAAENEYTFFPSFGNFFFDAKMPVTCPIASPAAKYGPRHLTRTAASDFWEGDDLQASLAGLDVLHANNFWCPRPGQLSRTRIVYTLHDIGFLDHPWWTTEANRIGCFEGVFRAATAADWVVAVSEASREHFLRVFPGFPRDRVTVAYPCSRYEGSEIGTPPIAELGPNRFWLNVGTIEPRKNQLRLVEAYADYRNRVADPMPLVLAGGAGWLMQDFRNRIAELGVAEHVVFTGYVSDDQLAWLYRNAYALVFPSLFEGFGLPVLEAMKFGTPVVGSDRTSIPEIIGDSGIVIDPDDRGALADLMCKLGGSSEMREDLAALAGNRASKFSIKSSVDVLAGVYRDVCQQSKRLSPSPR
jgi:glycosyltransferase involved in cell wall biosynthesis